MSELAKTTTIKSLLNQQGIQDKFEELLGKKSQGFISSILQIVNNNNLLKKADPSTILNAAATAAALDLPINPNLGFSWIVPYKGKAQFQMGWKGYVQLALRTGIYRKINTTEVYENQFKSFNSLTEELDADFSLEGKGEIIGYVAYFRLLSGFEKISYWPKEKVLKHAKKYSQAFGSKYSPWKDSEQIHAMCKKTVLKNTISKWGIMSLEIERAILSDQSVQFIEGQYEYLDNKIIDITELNKKEEESRILKFIKEAKTIEELAEIEPFAEGKILRKAYDKKCKELIK